MALFGMKLDAEEIIPLERSDEVFAIVSECDRIGWVIAHHPIRVDKVESLLVDRRSDNGIALNHANGIPAHVRHVQST